MEFKAWNHIGTGTNYVGRWKILEEAFEWLYCFDLTENPQKLEFQRYLSYPSGIPGFTRLDIVIAPIIDDARDKIPQIMSCIEEFYKSIYAQTPPRFLEFEVKSSGTDILYAKIKLSVT